MGGRRRQRRRGKKLPGERGCIVPGCDNVHSAKGLCAGHYLQQCKGKPLKPLRTVKKSPYKPYRVCSFDGCNNEARSRGLCAGHYAQYRSGKKLTEILAHVNSDLISAGFKKCRRCKKIKMIEDFCKNYDRKGTYLMGHCIACQRMSERKKKYGISEEQYHDMLRFQDEKCAICRTDLTKQTDYLDHDHVTGNIRGLLCSTCNTGLGHFYDTPEILRSAARYLEERKSDMTAAYSNSTTPMDDRDEARTPGAVFWWASKIFGKCDIDLAATQALSLIHI